MKRNNFWLTILAIVLATTIGAVGCDNGTTDDNNGQQKGKGLPPAKGKMTINGFTPDFENRYVYVQGMISDIGDIYNGKFLYGMADLTISYAESLTTFKLVKITNGSAVVPLYTLKDIPATSVSSFIAYDGNDPVSGGLGVYIYLFDVPELDSNNIAAQLVSTIFSGDYMLVTTGAFSNGNLTVTWSK